MDDQIDSVLWAEVAQDLYDALLTGDDELARTAMSNYWAVRTRWERLYAANDTGVSRSPQNACSIA